MDHAHYAPENTIAYKEARKNEAIREGFADCVEHCRAIQSMAADEPLTVSDIQPLAAGLERLTRLCSRRFCYGEMPHD